MAGRTLTDRERSPAAAGSGRFHADAVGDPGYREALEAARGPVSGGVALEDAVRVYRPAS
jgi:hypothetical protein